MKVTNIMRWILKTKIQRSSTRSVGLIVNSEVIVIHTSNSR